MSSPRFAASVLLIMNSGDVVRVIQIVSIVVRAHPCAHLSFGKCAWPREYAEVPTASFIGIECPQPKCTLFDFALLYEFQSTGINFEKWTQIFDYFLNSNRAADRVICG